MIKDIIKMAISNLTHRKMRSWLTMIGIFIGITAVIAIISLGQGLQYAINDQFTKLGTDKLFLTPGGGGLSSTDAIKLTDRDITVIERVPGVDSTVGIDYQSAKVTYKNDVAYSLVMGAKITSKNNKLWQDTMGINIDQGRLISSDDVYKAYVGYDFSQDDKVFPRGLKLYDKININGQDFQIIGFQKKQGDSYDDQQIVISSDAYERVFGQRISDDYKEIIIKTKEKDPNLIAADIKQQLRKDRDKKEGEEDFTLQTTEELMDSFNSVLLIVQVVIIGIAAISLVVGGIGIMNTMYTAVVERTQEIGIMKAIGAKNSDILIIFMVEAGVLGLIGGIIGVLIGLGIAKMVEIFGTIYLGTPLLKAWWSWELILGALAFAFIVGMASGTLPAYQASKQKPVDSLRYE